MNFQAIATYFGESGCYLDSIIKAGELFSDKSIDRLRYYERAKSFDWILANCYVNSPDDILQDITDKAWSVRKESALYKCKRGEIEILRYEWIQKPGVTLGHFVLGDGFGNVKYDPMGDASPVVRFGTLISKRIFSEVV